MLFIIGFNLYWKIRLTTTTKKTDKSIPSEAYNYEAL